MHEARITIGQLKVSSHRLDIKVGKSANIPRAEPTCGLCQLEVEGKEHFAHRLDIKVGKSTHIPRAETTCGLCQLEIEGKEHFAFTCNVYQEINLAIFPRYTSLRHIMESADQRQFGRLLLEMHFRRVCSKLPNPLKGVDNPSSLIISH